MKRRMVIEVDVNDESKGCMLHVLDKITGVLEELVEQRDIHKYGIDLVTMAFSPSDDYVIPIETMEISEDP